MHKAHAPLMTTVKCAQLHSVQECLRAALSYLPSCYDDLTFASGCCSLRCRAAIEKVCRGRTDKWCFGPFSKKHIQIPSALHASLSPFSKPSWNLQVLVTCFFSPLAPQLLPSLPPFAAEPHILNPPYW